MKESRYCDFAERFRDVISKNASGMGQSELARLLGTGQSTISKAISGSHLPSDSVILRIKELWGIDMVDDVKALRESARYNVKKKDKNSSVEQSTAGIPYFDVDFVGGFDIVMNDQTINPDGFVNVGIYKKATCLCNITGHSMEPEISNGDIIVLRKIDDWRFIPFGEIYAIVTTNNMRTVKRVGPGSDDNCYMLIPSNKSPGYAPQELRKEDILQVFEVMGVMKKL